MKVLKRILAAAAVLCLLVMLVPSAFAADDPRFQDRTWEDITLEFLGRVGATETGTICIGYYNTVTGEEQFYNPDTYITVGSVYKVPLNMIYCEKIANGEMTLDSTVFGVPYNTLLRGTIIDSNNDYAKTLWDNLGSYHHYRELIAPYMGEDAATVSAKFYENNFFTARQMITCLRTLYENPDRFPYLVDVMKEAEPDNYFNRNETRYEIAHKYGYNNEAWHYYIADSGIIYTTDPYLLVVFTDNSPSAYDILAEYEVLMSDYTEYHTKERLTAGAVDAAVEQLTFPAAPSAVKGGAVAGSAAAAETSYDTDLPTFTKILGVLAAMLFLLGIFAKLGKHTGYVILLPALIVTVLGLLFIRSLLTGGASLIADKGDGSQTTAAFFEALEGRDYAAACKLLDGYAALGLEEVPEGEQASRIYELMRSGYVYTPGPVTPGAEKDTATQSVTLRHFSYGKLRNAVKESMKTLLNSYTEQRSESEIYDENYAIRSEVAREAFQAAMEGVLAAPAGCLADEQLDVALRYSTKGWRIVPDEAFMNAVCCK